MENENAILNEGEVVSPQSVAQMDDDTFEAYIKSAKEADGEVQAESISGAAEPAENDEEVYISFKTKEELQEYQNRTIGDRLREIREASEKKDERLSEVFSLAKSLYDTDSQEDAIYLLERELKEKNAQKAGMTEGEYALLDELKGIRSEVNYQRQVEEIKRDWERQSEAIKHIDPDFDLQAAFENPRFYQSVVGEHKSLAEAYPLLRKRTQRQAINEVGNLTNGVSGSVRHDVKSMSDKEFDEYISRIKNS